MKLPLLTIILVLAQQAFPQDTARHRLVLSISGGVFLPRHPGRNVIDSFSYTSTPANTGIPSNHEFVGSLGRNFYSVAFVGDIMNYEFTSYHDAINFGVGQFTAANFDDGGYLKAGYARVLRFHRNRFRFQPGMNAYVMMGSRIDLGEIDNNGKTLQFLGHTAAPTWTYSYTDRSGHHTHTYSADHLSVYYTRNALLIQPNVALSTTMRRLVVGLQTGWMLQLSQGCHLILDQKDNGSDSNRIARIREPRNGLLNGFYSTLSLGIVSRPRNPTKTMLSCLVPLYGIL